MGKLGDMATWFSDRGRVVALVLIGWVALVVTGAGRKPDSAGWFDLPNLQTVAATIMGLLALCGLVMLPFMIRRHDGPPIVRPKTSIRALFVITAFIVVLVLAFGPQDLTQDPIVEEPLPTGSVPEEVAIDQPDDGAILWLLLTSAAAGAVLLWSRRQMAPALGDLTNTGEPALETELGPAIDTAIELLMKGGDPRTAVLAAYASLERHLAEHGRGRNRSETATEHLTRALRAIPIVAGPAVQLGELYELARFSDHPITSQDQQQAAQALDRSRRELAELLSTSK